MENIQRSAGEIAGPSSEGRIVEDLGRDFVAYGDERLGDDFIEYLARRLGVGRAVACHALSEWLNHHAGSDRPGLRKAMPGIETAPTGAFAASQHALR
jgi:hypothetical protein